MSTKEPLLTVREVAEELRLTPPTVRRLVAAGELPAVRVGATTLRFRRSELEAALTTPIVTRVEEDPA